MSINSVLKEELNKIKVSDEDYETLNRLSGIVIEALNRKLKRKGISATAFIGGSLAKKTLIKRPKYDVDIFLRFNRKYSEQDIKKLMKKIFFWFRIRGYRRKLRKIHGSRDYYKIVLRSFPEVTFEIIPTVAIKTPGEARNITDLSYFHVSHMEKEMKKNKKLSDEILLAKSFCYSQKCYGAESYIKGFSGYALELLVAHYKSFTRFLREVSKAKEQMVVDSAKHYKNKKQILESLNPAKLKSPVVLIDPTFMERNAAGALSKETFNKFKTAASGFLGNPSERYFSYKTSHKQEIRDLAKRLEGIYAVFEIHTRKQEGDIAGSKMLKFSKTFTRELAKVFNIVDHYFEYEAGKKSHVYYVLQRKKEIIHKGPSIHYKKAVENFKEKHPIWYVEEGYIKSAKPTNVNVKDFLKNFRKTRKRTMKEMGITKVRVV